MVVESLATGVDHRWQGFSRRTTRRAACFCGGRLGTHLPVTLKVDTVTVLVADADDTWTTRAEIPLAQVAGPRTRGSGCRPGRGL